MRKLCRVDLGAREEIYERIERYKSLVVEKLKPQAVVLFGSFATGDVNEGSDVDILVIADFRQSFFDRIGLLMDLNDETGLPLEPVGYTPEEVRTMKERGNRFIDEVLATGKLLHGAIA